MFEQASDIVFFELGPVWSVSALNTTMHLQPLRQPRLAVNKRSTAHGFFPVTQFRAGENKIVNVAISFWVMCQ